MKPCNFLFKQIKLIVLCQSLLLSTIASAQQAGFIWSEEHDRGSRIILSMFQDGAWQPGRSIVDDDNWNMLPTLGADSNNRNLAVWSVVEDQRSVLKFSTESDGQWQPAQVLTTQMSTNLAPVFVFDNSDTGWLFWSANSDDDDDIYMSQYTSGTWSSPVRVHEENNRPDILPEAGMDDSGNVWVSWQTLTDEGYIVRTRSFSAGSRKMMDVRNSISKQQLEQLKSRSAIQHTVSPPPYFKSLGRASFYFPDDRIRPTRTVKGNLGL